MSQARRSLAGVVVGVSVSESDDSTRSGFPPWQVNRLTLQVASALIGQGAGVLFGHDWRDDGVMEAVHGFALSMQPLDELSSADSPAGAQPLLCNVLPWPDKPYLSGGDRERLCTTLRVEEAGLPEELEELDELARREGRSSPIYGYLRARALTHLRHRLNKISHARLCLGGRRAGYEGRYPGIVEEALLAAGQRVPLYVAGVLGGAARQVIDALEGRPQPPDFCVSRERCELYCAPPSKAIEQASATIADRKIDADYVWAEFRRIGVPGLSRANGLSEAENHELFHTPALDRVIQLTLTGLSRLRLHERD